ncbi:MAG: hypothetical protein JWL59_569 [Chthoniobacteraceae bacterium]|nr:hypothetical protein [Chthoniobacteraceae bacterium]
MHHLNDLTLKTTRRVASASILAALGASVFFLYSPSLLAKTAKLEMPTPPAESAQQFQAALKKPIAKASIEEIEKALRAAIIANPQEAPNYVAVIFKSDRRHVCPESARIVSVAIESLGKKPPAELIYAIVRVSILLDEECAPVIVKAAIKAAPRPFAYRIMEVAVASLHHPGDFVRDGKQLSNVTMAEALANSTLEEFPDLDPALVNAAAGRGLLGLGGDGLNFASDNTPIFNTGGGGSQLNNPNPDTTADSN